ncbi:hypothetical protein GCM10022416_23280 [Actinomadura keratinilytica]|uniref:Transposase n=1 Tax=Actinomadura keratinilytica TaxID=547461 RepID=A0ABP7YM52_9ACTN
MVANSLGEQMRAESRWYSETAQAWIAKGRAEGFAEGITRGMARGLLLLLEAREIEISEEQRRRIGECRDSEQLKMWVDRALEVSSADGVFS